MASPSFVLEDSRGNIISNPGDDQIRDIINQVGRGIDHCILRSESTYIQATPSGKGLMVEFSDGTGVTQVDRTDFSPQEVQEFFSAFNKQDNSWKEKFKLSRVNSPGKEGPADQESRPQFNVKDEVNHALKREGRYRLRRFIRRGLSLLTGLFIRRRMFK